MTTQQRNNYRNFRNTITPEQLLSNAFTTIGPELAEKLGLMRNGGTDRYPRFNLVPKELLEWQGGHVLVDVSDTSVNSGRKFEDEDGVEHVRKYGGLMGIAHVNVVGQGTLSSNYPCVLLPDYKNNNERRAAIYQSFAEAVKGLKGVESVEINPASIRVFQSLNCDFGKTHSIIVIEVAGMMGKCKGKDFSWSIMEKPEKDFQHDSTSEESASPRTRRTNRSRSRSAESNPTPADDQSGANADMAGVMADA
jgi:hypothetical protein